MGLLLLLLDVLLLEDLHGIGFVGVVLFDQNHLGVGAFSDNTEQFKVVQGDGFADHS